MNRRSELRVSRRFPCEIDTGAHRYRGAVVNLSRHGLFVQTRMRLGRRPRIRLAIHLSLPPDYLPLRLSTVVARQYRVPAALVTAAGGGVGLRIRSAPEAWSRFLEHFGPREPARGDEPPTPRTRPEPRRCLLCERPPLPASAFCAGCLSARP